MPPKGKGAVNDAVIPVNLIDRLFPAWNDADVANDKGGPGAYEDIDGLIFPAETKHWLDCWKRPDEVVIGDAKAEVVEMERLEVNGQKLLGGTSGRVFKGALYFGHPHFEWLMGIFLFVQQIQSQIPKGGYLFELIHPQTAGLPVLSPNGKYHVKLWIMDKWRRIVVDDRVPVDLFGRALCVGSRPLQLWPILLSKALFKVSTAYHILGRHFPDQVPAFHWLTGWPLEDLVLPLNGISLQDGDLFDRLEASVGEHPTPTKRRTITSAHLRVRAEPDFPPPRVFVFSGPPGVGTSKVLKSFVQAYPNLFAEVVSHTTRAPMEHEIEGTDYFFTDKPTIRAMQDNGEFLEVQKISTVHGREQLYGTSYASIRSVAAGGKICVTALDINGAKALHADDRINAVFIYLAPPSVPTLERRLRHRLKEHESTIQKRLTWAAEQVKLSSSPGLVDVVVDNSNDKKQVYWDIKEAIAQLSPIVRNRLHGIPAYILDYSDLIIANQVEKPFLKPVLLCGPCTTEKWEFLQTLADEFPDVFAFPQLYTDEAESDPHDPYDDRSAPASRLLL